MARKDDFFAGRMRDNASRSEHLPPHQGGRYVGFGSDPTPPPRPGGAGGFGGGPKGQREEAGQNVEDLVAKGFDSLSLLGKEAYSNAS